MAKIKFSHAYTKLLHEGEPVKEAKLLLVVQVRIEDITESKDFLNYDTDNGKYNLMYSSLYAMLLFQKPSGDVFTTVRPAYGRYGNKYEYYKKFIGQVFDVVITTEVHG